MVFSTRCLNIELERKEEIRDAALDSSDYVNNYYNIKDNNNNTYDAKLDKAYSYFICKYNQSLNPDERCIFNLYVILPDDEFFMSLIEKYEKDFDKVANIFAINVNIIKLRYYLQKNILTERNNANESTYKKQ